MGTATSTGAPERARWPRPAAAPHPRLRSAHAAMPASPRHHPRHLVLPATTSVPLVVKLVDSPPAPSGVRLRRGCNSSYSVVEGDCALSYLELAGPAGPTKPIPSPEVDRAWERLVASAGAAPIARVADEVGWSHKHLIARFKRQVGLRPKTAARLVRFERVLGRLDERRGWTGGWSPASRLRRPGASHPRLPPVHRHHPDRLRGPDARARRGWGTAGQFRSRHRRRRFLAWPSVGPRAKPP